MRSAVMTAFVLGSLALHASPITIASDLGAGNTFQTGTGNAWSEGGSQNDANAVSFVVPTGEYALSQILVADNWFAGSAPLVVGIYFGSDPNTATLLESFTIPTSATTQFATNLFTLTSVLQPVLFGGDTYLIQETVPACGSASSCSDNWGWQWNNQGENGFFSSVAGFAGGSWFPETVVTPAFAVLATPVPEPGSCGGVFLALLTLASFGARRNFLRRT